MSARWRGWRDDHVLHLSFLGSDFGAEKGVTRKFSDFYGSQLWFT